MRIGENAANSFDVSIKANREANLACLSLDINVDGAAIREVKLDHGDENRRKFTVDMNGSKLSGIPRVLILRVIDNIKKEVLVEDRLLTSSLPGVFTNIIYSPTPASAEKATLTIGFREGVGLNIADLKIVNSETGETINVVSKRAASDRFFLFAMKPDDLKGIALSVLAKDGSEIISIPASNR